jgi:hypothetical protein
VFNSESFEIEIFKMLFIIISPSLGVYKAFESQAVAGCLINHPDNAYVVRMDGKVTGNF